MKPLFLKNRDYDKTDCFDGYPNTWFLLMPSHELENNHAKVIFICEREFLLFRYISNVLYVGIIDGLHGDYLPNIQGK